jgi:hypothetical protein
MNRPCIQRTVFKNYGSNDESYGYRIYDDHGQSYCNIMEEKDLKLSDPDFLRKAHETFDDVADSIFDFALERGIYIDDNWYEFGFSDDNGSWCLKEGA